MIKDELQLTPCPFPPLSTLSLCPCPSTHTCTPPLIICIAPTRFDYNLSSGTFPRYVSPAPVNILTPRSSRTTPIRPRHSPGSSLMSQPHSIRTIYLPWSTNANMSLLILSAAPDTTQACHIYAPCWLFPPRSVSMLPYPPLTRPSLPHP